MHSPSYLFVCQSGNLTLLATSRPTHALAFPFLLAALLKVSYTYTPFPTLPFDWSKNLTPLAVPRPTRAPSLPFLLSPLLNWVYPFI